MRSVFKMASFVRRDFRNNFPLDHKKLTFMIVTMIIVMVLISLVGTKPFSHFHVEIEGVKEIRVIATRE